MRHFTDIDRDLTRQCKFSRTEISKKKYNPEITPKLES
jgi:hypothetical protein